MALCAAAGRETVGAFVEAPGRSRHDALQRDTSFHARRPGSPMIVIFNSAESSDSHAKFQLWRRENPDGYVLNCQTSNSGMVHCAKCIHLEPTGGTTEDGGDFARHGKVCSLSIQDLPEWAAEHGVTSVCRCGHCKPCTDLELLDLVRLQPTVEGDFDPKRLEDARHRTMAAIVRRRGQPRFRRKLVKAYGSRCAFSGCEVGEILDAAHIVPYWGADTNHIQNGLLLRSDLHTLFDLGLLGVDTSDMTIVVSPDLQNSEYAAFAGKRIAVPSDAASHPSAAALDRHRERAGLHADS